jgi:hypothetical protein
VDRQRCLAQLDKAWSDLQESCAGLTEQQLAEPGVAGDWSVKDILAHVTTWEEEALEQLPVIAQGGKTRRYSVSYGGIDAFNALMTQRKRVLSLSDVVTQLDETHRRLVEYIQTVSEDQFTQPTRFRRRLRLDTYGHYPKHAQAIRRWRERRSWP